MLVTGQSPATASRSLGRARSTAAACSTRRSATRNVPDSPSAACRQRTVLDRQTRCGKECKGPRHRSRQLPRMMPSNNSDVDAARYNQAGHVPSTHRRLSPRSRAARTSAITATGKVRPSGLIGCGGRGTHDAGLLKKTPNVEVAYVCDRRSTRREAAAKGLGSSNRAVADMRRILDDKTHRRRHCRHARPLALAGRDPGLRRRQARVRRKADLAQHPRGPAAGRGRAAKQAPRAARHAKPQHADDDRGGEAAPRRHHRQRAGRQMLEHPAPRLDRPRQAEPPAGRLRLRRLGRPGHDDSLPHQPRPQPLDTGGITSAPATWATTASTTSTTRGGAWASRRTRRKSRPWAASTSSTTTSSFPTRSK